ncbi:MAG: VOC family protein [Lachnospiraceae bacterium]|nr:VOC family protein [Lachnospiraceae bacterium]
MIKRFACVNLSTKDPEGLAKFYRTIGVPVFVKNDRYDGWYLGNPESETSVCVWDENRWGKSTEGFITLVFVVDDLEKTYDEIKSKNINIDKPIRTAWGGKELSLKDPDGNIIIFLT